jgi:hypothetical protein
MPTRFFSTSQKRQPRVFPTQVLLDIGAQPVMLGKKVAKELQLKKMDLEPCPFTIVTSLGSTKHVIRLTKDQICLEFKVGPNEVTHLNLKCVVIGAKTYDIMLGQ